MPKTKKRKKASSFPGADPKTVVPEKIIPLEVRRIMVSYRNSPKMAEAVMEFINNSGRQLAEDTISFLVRSRFTVEQIPKMSAQSAIGFN